MQSCMLLHPHARSCARMQPSVQAHEHACFLQALKQHACRRNSASDYPHYRFPQNVSVYLERRYAKHKRLYFT